MAARILIADDEDSLRWVLEKGLRGVGYDVTSVKDGEEAVRVFEAQPFDLVFLDVRMPGLDGLTALERIRDLRPDVYVIVMTAHGSMDTAIKAMQRGAYDYLNKPFDLDEVLLLSERALAASRLTQEVARLRTGLAEVREFSALIGRHPRMQDVYKTIGRIAGTDVTVLLRGESGTGKELVARAIHHYSRRSGRPFVAVSCAAIPGTLLESEMFGHERGAFTDAKERRLGKFELAHGGTLYLDEIGDMPVDLQTKLLRALQERTIERVGGHESIAIDVRVLAATNRDLEALMKEGRFREDLYYRLNVVTVNLPPLRERRRDIPLLVEHFLAKHVEELGERGVAPEALDRLVGYDWPGNVRELENVVQRAMVMATAGVILPEHLPIGPVSAAASVAVDATLEEIIERKLMECVRGLRERSSANLYDLVVGLVEKPLLR
ncbi:MAG: two-component system response regulator, partial [Candidatus Rokubacteria bacterium 13_2_20CM_2_64_8]